MLFFISACNSVDRYSVLKQCTVLGDESIAYARAHYVKLFYHFNPDKFLESYQQINNFDAVTLKNTIDTYTRAIDKFDANTVETNNQATKNLLLSCKRLALFSTDFVENDYKIALNHNSKNTTSSDDFFIEINRIVKFDHNIGTFDNKQISFKATVENYRKAVKNYIEQYRKDIPSDFIKLRSSK